ncbi:MULTISPECIES: putative sulfate exporter family transporter [Ramlibacter]|uniref:Sulfate exporter family transporter n=1 Tax=Ramlibacter aquaticus TaxID=2780094 RepID=A0ABR9SD20_9BURK|nr:MULTISPECIES: putative sulfate exporter family transporter [Ramlibacter]MBE7940258.1 putative sulfate exporter family transporter [Ramlibacter aquaticus]
MPHAAPAARARVLAPGVIACAVVGAAATFLSEHYGAPVMLFALLLGMAMNFLSAEGPCAPGIEFSAKALLRLGIALLGLRITLAQVQALGWGPVLFILGAVALTIACAMLAARLLGFQPLFGLLTGGATAICGASAALALSAALPTHPGKDRATLFTVIGVSALSTLAMVLYPMVVHALGLSDRAAGMFLGGTIHDVAQVVGAGYSISTPAGDTATLVKLLRVATLLPVILFTSLLTRSRQDAAAHGPRPPLLPWFAVAFAVLVAVNSTGWIPRPVQAAGNDLSRWLLVASIAGIGMKTQLRELVAVGLKPVLLMLGETLFLALLTLACLRWLA